MKNQPEAPTQPPNTGIFPLHPDIVEDFRDLFASSSDRVLEIIRRARVHGPENEIFAFVYRRFANEWANWHVKESDFSDSPTARQHYDIGLLYGIDMAQQISRQQRVGDNLTVDNVDTLNQAADYLLETYRGLPDSEEMPGWKRQKLRELRYTGSDILTIANATLNDKIRSMMGEQAQGNDTQAVLVGLVDGVVLLNAYERLLAGQEPVPFDDPTEYIPVYDPRKHVRDLDNAADWALSHVRVEMDEDDSLSQAFSEAMPVRGSFVEEPFHAADAMGQRRLLQFGPNAFGFGIEVQELKVKGLTFRRPLILTAGFVLMSDGIWAAQEVFEYHRSPGVLDMTIQTLIGGLCLRLVHSLWKGHDKKMYSSLYDIPIVKKFSEPPSRTDQAA